MLDEASQDELNELTENIESSCSEVKVIYEELHRMQTLSKSFNAYNKCEYTIYV